MSSATEPAPTRTTRVRSLATCAALVVVVLLGLRMLAGGLIASTGPRPADFLQVWAAGQLALSGENPYDGERMFALQSANRIPQDYAAMMWVPPWGLAVAVPLGALPIDLAQHVWVGGQFVLVLASALLLWWVYGGPMHRAWVPLALAAGSGPLWWQTLVGQYAGLLLFAMAGFLAARRANRPILAGACLFLIALKPHLFALFAIGLLIDALRTPVGRRVVFGGALVLVVASAAVTLLNPELWKWYQAAAGGGRSEYYPALSDWFNPTLHAWVRSVLPGKPFWVQFVPLALAAPAFAAYWWRHGNPDRWPDALPWVIPVCLLVAPYGSWPSDFTLFLVPVVWVAVRLDAIGWAIPNRAPLLAVYILANLGVMVMLHLKGKIEYYVWVGPVLCGCLFWAYRESRREAAPPETPREADALPAVAQG